MKHNIPIYKTKVQAFSLRTETLAIIDEVAKDFDPPNRSAALRQIVKEWEEAYSPARNVERNEK